MVEVVCRCDMNRRGRKGISGGDGSGRVVAGRSAIMERRWREES